MTYYRDQMPPHTCEGLGICQHPERECSGACEQIPALPICYAEPEPTPMDAIYYWACVTLLAVISIAILGGLAGWFYGTVYHALAHAFWGWTALKF